LVNLRLAHPFKDKIVKLEAFLFEPSLLAGSLIAGFFVMPSKASSVAEDREALLARMRQRRYPETLPVLAYYWLKTLHASGYGRRQWKKLSSLLRRALGEQLPDSPSHQAIVSIQARIQHAQSPFLAMTRSEYQQAAALPKKWIGV